MKLLEANSEVSHLLRRRYVADFLGISCQVLFPQAGSPGSPVPKAMDRSLCGPKQKNWANTGEHVNLPYDLYNILHMTLYVIYHRPPQRGIGVRGILIISGDFKLI